MPVIGVPRGQRLGGPGDQQAVEALAAQALSALQDQPVADAIIDAVGLVFDLVSGGLTAGPPGG